MLNDRSVQSRTYTFYLDPALGEGGKVFHSGGDARELTVHGLFGAILAEPAGSHWLDPETAADQTANANWSNWEAIIDPASGPTFREFGIIYHEFGDEFENLRNRANGALAMVEAVAFSYRPASRLLNYRSEPFQNRLNEALTTDKASGYNSYTYGDPATPIARSYLGEPTKMRLMHAGSEMLHVHHLHGGGDRWRANPGADNTDVGDCVNISLNNDIDYINNLPSPQSAIDRNHKTNRHTHFVQFDPQGSDGVDTGFSFEQSIRFDGAELPSTSTGDPDVDLTLRRTLTADSAAGDSTITVNSSARLKPGIAIAVGQGAATIEFRNVTATTPTTVTLDAPLANAHAIGETTGVEFARYQWYSDVDSGTVFWHDHVDGVHSWSRGLFGAHIIEPKGSDYLDPKTLTHVDSGDDVVIKPGVGASSPGVDLAAGRSFREYMIWLSNGRDTPQSRVATNRNFGQECEQGVINLHSEPYASRVPAALQVVEPNGGLCHNTIDTTDPNVFSSVTYGDPFTHLFRAYVGDPVVIRTLGLDERTEALRIQGHRFRRERFNTQGELMDAATTGISERFDYVLDGGAGGPKGKPGDYLYYTTRNFARADGGWGIFRVHDKLQTDLKPLPDRTTPPTGAGFPQQTFTGGNPVHSNGADTSTCVSSGTSAPVRSYSLAIFDKPLPVTQTINGDRPLDANGLPFEGVRDAPCAGHLGPSPGRRRAGLLRLAAPRDPTCRASRTPWLENPMVSGQAAAPGGAQRSRVQWWDEAGRLAECQAAGCSGGGWRTTFLPVRCSSWRTRSRWRRRWLTLDQ